MFVPGAPAPAAQPIPPVPSFPRPSPAAALPTLVPQQPPPMQAMQPTIPAPPPMQPQGPLGPQGPAMHAAPPMQPQPAPIMPIPAAQPPPYLASQTATRAGRPIEPWRHSLRLMMFLWGVALLAAFATPLRISPDLQFQWNLILDGEGMARLPPLMLAALGLLSVVVAAIPMPPVARGVIATLLGLAGIAVPIALAGVPPWLALVSMIGMLLLVPSLLVRNEYRDALVPRVLVTLGAIGILLPFLLPQGGAIPLVNVFKQLIDLPGSAKVGPALELGLITIVVMSLLAWLPSPISGGAVLWSWLLMLWALIVHATQLVLAGHLADVVTASPSAALTPWISGGPALGTAYLVLVGYGLATVLGKQLE
jgi:hypothetical protein